MPRSHQRLMNLQEWALLLALSILWGGSFLFNSHALRDIPVLTVVLCRVALTAPILLAVLRLRGERMPRDRRIGLAAMSTALAYMLCFRLRATAGATNLRLVTFLVPVSAILSGTLCLAKALLPRQVAGMALIGTGLAAIDGRLWRVIRAAAGRRNRAA